MSGLSNDKESAKRLVWRREAAVRYEQTNGSFWDRASPSSTNQDEPEAGACLSAAPAIQSLKVQASFYQTTNRLRSGRQVRLFTTPFVNPAQQFSREPQLKTFIFDFWWVRRV
jgi:hypothetical protein